MKRFLLFITGCFAALSMTAQTIITEAKDTIILTKQTVSKTIKVGVLAYKDSVIRYDTTIQTVKKYVPPVVDPGNQLPTANAGADKTLQLPTNKIFLVGDGGDVDGLFTVQWSIVSGQGVVVNGNTLVNASVEQITIPGTIVVRLTVTDDKGARATDDMNITVVAAPVDPGTEVKYSYTATQIATDYQRPFGGVEQWHDRNDINVPTEGTNTQRSDVYWRFAATRIAGNAKGIYNWSYLDGLFNAAINAKQKISFGIMTLYPEGTTNEGLAAFDGGYACYPQWLHLAMQAEAVKDWRTGNTWTPNYNSNSYLTWLLDLNTAINAHLEATSFNGVKYKDIVNCIDIRGYGAWGEWHSGYTPNNVVSDYPAGTFPTIATLKKIVDAHTQGFPNIQLVAMIAAFDGMRLNNTKNPVEIGYYILTQRNNAGLIGWRRDQYGATDDYIQWYLEKNPNTFNGAALSTLIMDRWKSAPITGEPPAWNPNDYADLERQVKLYHTTCFGNGNYGVTPNATIKTRVRAAAAAIGSKLTINSAEVGVAGNNIRVLVIWENKGIAPTYENWNTTITLVDAANVVRLTYVSTFIPRLFLPGAVKANTDLFTIPTAGTYKVNVSVKDAAGYRSPYPLAISGRNADGSYTVATITVK